MAAIIGCRLLMVFHVAIAELAAVGTFVHIKSSYDRKEVLSVTTNLTPG